MSKEKHVKVKSSKNLIIGAVAVVVVVLAAIVVFAVPFSYTAVEVYTEQESYDSQEPYTDEVCNQVSIKGNFYIFDNIKKGVCDEIQN